jgi:hypothetical protein
MFSGLINRLTDPGSIRSLVLFLFMVKGAVPVDATVDLITNAVIAGIAGVSFLMKPKAPVAVVPVPAAVAEATVGGTVVEAQPR